MTRTESKLLAKLKWRYQVEKNKNKLLLRQNDEILKVLNRTSTQLHRCILGWIASDERYIDLYNKVNQK